MISISVLIPTYQEKKYIAGCLDSLLAGAFDFESSGSEILVIDGGSRDGTREIVERYAGEHAFIRLLDNPFQIQVKALNIGLEAARGDVIFRCDAHCEYPADYIPEILARHAENAADSIGGRCRTRAGADTAEARAIALVMNSKLGMGHSHRTLSTDRPRLADTVAFGSWKRALFDEVGRFDEEFIRAEDLEHNVRLCRAGKKVMFLPWLKVDYYARDKLSKIAHEFFQTGYWKIRINAKHKTVSSIRQLIPTLYLVANLMSLPLLEFSSLVLWLFLCYNSLYLALIVFRSMKESIARRDPYLFPYMLCAFAIIHHSYASGYVKGFVDVFIRKCYGGEGNNRLLTGVTR